MRFLPLLSLATLLMATSGSALALSSGLERSNMDSKVRPQDDLYLATNGAWLSKTEIPADKSNYGAFIALDDLTRERLRGLIDEVARRSHPAGSEARKVADFHKSFMDEVSIARRGLEPLKTEIDAIRSLASHAALSRHLGALRKLDVRVPFAFFVAQDQKDSTRYLGTFFQSGTGMPDRDYYLKADPKFAEARTAYASYAAKLLRLAGLPSNEAESAAREILVIETRMAEAQWTKVALRDEEKNYNKMDRAVLAKLTPSIDWSAYFEGLGIPVPEEVNVGQPSFVQSVDGILSSTPLATWRHYLLFHLIDTYAFGLPPEFERAHFELHGKTLAGIPEDEPRWKKAIAAIGGRTAGDFGMLGDAVGRLYVEKYFPASAKARMDELVKNLLTAFDRSINDLSWMTTETKAKARIKLSKYSTKIGYPDTWRDYSGLVVKADDLMANLLASARYETQRNLSKLGKPVDRGEWGMTPQTVNAYYNPSLNEIVFPAGILQPPFFNPAADDAVNYGAIGAVIGHEISHGFDDQGCQYDGDGNLKNWWTEEDKKAFKALTERLVAQYDAYEALPGKKVNGTFTLGENIADLCGLAIAHKAYRIALRGSDATVIEGLTGDQRFFMGWAQVWRRKYRDAELVKRLLTDPHSPSHFRGNGPVVHSAAFMAAFGVKPGDGMFRPEAERLTIW